ncbi:MAG TPA: hypothetical protein VJ927_10000 [Actinomycetota bacterium]|nr:hypothetical protein [Actinomycetota bacterium]
MAETKRCPNCGGSNPVDAEWCGQCLERFTPKPEPEPVPETPPQPQPVSEVAPAAVAAGLLPPVTLGEAEPAERAPMAPPPEAAIGVTRGAFTVREHGVVWTCPRCENENALDAQTCAVCGTPFAEIARPKVERPQRDPGTAALVSLFLPGAGHGYLGMWGQAVARAVLSVWVVFVVLISLLQRGRGSAMIATVFAVAATGLWAVAAHDAYREARDEASMVLLKGKVFLYLVLGLLVLLLVLLTSAGLGGARA